MRSGHFAGLAGQHVFFAHDQQLRVFLAVDAIPAVERRSLVDIGWQPRIVEREQGFFVSQDVAAARLGLQFVELLEQLRVGGQAPGSGLDFPAHQAFTNKQLTGQYWLDRPVMHRPPANHDQPEQSDLFEGDNLPALLLPMGFEVVLLDQVPGQRFDPVRFDLRHHPRVKLGGFHQFCGHQPLRALFPKPR